MGHGGRESALGTRMSETSALHAFMQHANPTLIRCADRSGGGWTIGDVCDPPSVAAYAASCDIDIAMVSADDPLAAGVVDALLAEGIRTVGPTRAGAEIEWNKAFSRAVVDEVAPESNPIYRVIRSVREIDEAFDQFGDSEVAVKPAGLTGGKGVKVMGSHLKSKDEAKDYARFLIRSRIAGDSVVVEERIDGIEFTIQAVTDGETVVFPAPTYDYPYRFDGDTGPGTGGMGSFSPATDTLPFVRPEELASAQDIISRVIDYLRVKGRHFSGVLNSGFFISRGGLRVIEFNARFGDPECMNIMSIFDGDWPAAMEELAGRSLKGADLSFVPAASVVIYLVAPEYCLTPASPHRFQLKYDEINEAGCHVFFAAGRYVGGEEYESVGSSRVVGLATRDGDLEVARTRVVQCIDKYFDGPLDWRRDIASRPYIEALCDRRSSY